MDPVLPMRPLGELLSSELGRAAQQTHQGRRASGWTLKIVEFARRLNVLAQLGLLMTFQFVGAAAAAHTFCAPETRLPGWGGRTRTRESVRALSDRNRVTTSPERA